MTAVEPLPTVEEIAAWMRVPFAALEMAKAASAPAAAARDALRGVWTSAPVGVWWDPGGDGIYASREHPATADSDMALAKSALARVGLAGELPCRRDTYPDGLIKIGATPILHRMGEALNFFPGTYPGGIPNHAGPVAGMLTSGLVGAGLGYGAGWLGERLLPDRWRRGRLSKTLAAIGGGAGLGLGSLYGVSNLKRGLPFNDSSLFHAQAGAAPEYAPTPAYAGTAADAAPPPGVPEVGPKFAAATARYAEWLREKAANELGDAFGGFAGQQQRGPYDVDVDAMGRLLWETGASPQTAGMTMGALAAAQQMPGGDGGQGPGYVTPWQMGQLAAHMGAGYLSGAVVGGVLGLLTGMPEDTQERLRQAGAITGIVRAVVPTLFGG